MRSIDVEVAEGVRLNVRHRPGAGRAFVLVHGLASNARLWDQVADSLAAAGHAVYAVDLRSHGESAAPDAGYDTETAANDVAALCQRLGLASVLAAGQSWGGNVVIRLAARHPELISGVALVDGGWIDLSAAFDTWTECESALRPPDVHGRSAADLRDVLTTAHPDWSVAAIEATLANLRVEVDGTLRRRLTIARHMAIVRSMWDAPPWRDYPAITAPVLLLPALPSENGESKRALVAKAAASLPRARVRDYVGADHDLHAQYPIEVATDLLALAAEV